MHSRKIYHCHLQLKCAYRTFDQRWLLSACLNFEITSIEVPLLRNIVYQTNSKRLILSQVPALCLYVYFLSTYWMERQRNPSYTNTLGRKLMLTVQALQTHLSKQRLLWVVTLLHKVFLNNLSTNSSTTCAFIGLLSRTRNNVFVGISWDKCVLDAPNKNTNSKSSHGANPEFSPSDDFVK